MQVSAGHLLGGRLRYAQPVDGYRTGIEPVLLAASVPARPGQRVLEAGTGAGAGLLCLAARVPHLSGVGVEIDPEMAELARRNCRDNGFDAVEIMTGDITQAAPGRCDHALANPPWHDPRSTPSPLERRRRAKQGGDGDLERWIGAIARTLAEGGSLTLIVPPRLLDRARAAAQACGFGAIVTRLLLPKPSRPAKLALLTAGLGRSEPGGTRPPLVLHEADGRYAAPIEAVLRGGSALDAATAR